MVFSQLGVPSPFVSQVSVYPTVHVQFGTQPPHPVPVHETVSVTIFSVAGIVLDDDVLHVPYVVFHAIGTKLPQPPHQIAQPQ